MSVRFLKFIPSDEAEQFAWNYPLAYALLSIVAIRARRTKKKDGLEIGECFLGDWAKSKGFSRQNYRTALKYLVQNNFLKITETNRTRKKSTTGLTTDSTKVKLLNSDIWDINPETSNHSNNHCPTTAQPLPNHKQECKERKEEERTIEKYTKEKDATSATSLPSSPNVVSFSEIANSVKIENANVAKNQEGLLDCVPEVPTQHNVYYQSKDNIVLVEKTKDSNDEETKSKSKKSKIGKTPKDSIPKINFREFVMLTEEEHAKLVQANGLPAVNQMLDILNAFKGSSGKAYKSDYHTMTTGGWVFQKLTTSKGGANAKFAKPLNRAQEIHREQLERWQKNNGDFCENNTLDCYNDV